MIRQPWLHRWLQVGLVCTLVGASNTTLAGALMSKHPAHSSIENAFIFWDASTNVQHLLLSFRIDVEGPFVFFLPFPSAVDARVVGDNPAVRAALSSVIAAYRARTKNWEVPSMQDGKPREDIVFGGLDAVDVSIHSISTKESMRALLNTHGQSNNLALKDYFERYAVATSHVVELRGEATNGIFTSPTIHLRFITQQPWYPYREPTYAQLLGQENPSVRLLRITMIDTAQVAVQHGRSVPTMNAAWLAFEPTLREVRDAFGSFMNAPPFEFPFESSFDSSNRLWLTSFEDRNATRPGDDDWVFVRTGEIPKSGQPGTVDDATKAGVVFDTLDVGEQRNEEPKDANSAADALAKTLDDAAKTVSTASDDSTFHHAVRWHRGRSARGLLVFGSMACFALGVVAWSCVQERRERQRRCGSRFGRAV